MPYMFVERSACKT